MFNIDASHLEHLIRLAAVRLPDDVVAVLQAAVEAEEPGSSAQATLQVFLENAALAAEANVPLCQDTGCLMFYIDHPEGWDAAAWRKNIAAAVAVASEKSYLRPNAVDSLSGKNSGNNLGVGFPQLHISAWPHQHLRIRLLLKGGGSENVGCQYSLPDETLGAGRDLEGVRRVLLHCVHTAQGKGCAPGILGVCIGGDRAAGYAEAKRQLLRPLDDMNENAALAALEQQVMREANSLGIGPLGLGGKTTLLGVKIGSLYRHPACYFVSVAYMCWECRRAALVCYPNGEVTYSA